MGGGGFSTIPVPAASYIAGAPGRRTVDREVDLADPMARAPRGAWWPRR